MSKRMASGFSSGGPSLRVCRRPAGSAPCAKRRIDRAALHIIVLLSQAMQLQLRFQLKTAADGP